MSAGAVVEVTVDAINVRAQPTVAASLAAPGDTGLLKRGDHVYLAEGPVMADGFDWYFISETFPIFWQPFGCTDRREMRIPGPRLDRHRPRRRPLARGC